MRYVIVAGVLLLAACADGGGTAETSTSQASSSASSSSSTVEQIVPPETPDSTPPSSDTTRTTTALGSEGEGVPTSLLEPVLLDAASRSGVEVGQVTVVSAELRDWPDGALGCPVPGMLYTQVITPGYQVVIEADGERFDYRMNRRGAFRLCETPGAIPDVRTPSTVIPGTTSPDT